MTKVLITGGSGFVAHHVIEHILKNTDWGIISVDRLSYSSMGYDRLRDIEAFDDERVTCYTADLTKAFGEGLKKEIGSVDYILHLASESHVDNSIINPVDFIHNNVDCTLYLLEYARELTKKGLKKFVQFSTDEVYGTAPKGTNHKEGNRFNAGNPYSASKAMQECMCQAYSNTFKVPIIITNTMNVLGERQHSEKYLPKIINSMLRGQKLTIHSDATRTKAGSRYYIHARNVADALLYILLNCDETLDNVDASKGKFHIVGEKELDNLELALIVERYVRQVQGYSDCRLNYEMVDFHSSRPGHDLRYALDGDKMKCLGWEPPVDIENSIKHIVEWSLNEKNIKWLN